ncbi:MAG: type II secretion system protein GspG [Planctomycetota bacterium]|nr:type II secretion system protein GspG [Planctomycetota bacterium]
MMRAALLAVWIVAAGCADEDPTALAQRKCRARYDQLMRWITGQARVPEPHEEKVAAGLDEPDPWGHPYVLDFGDETRVWSWGPDGKEGTRDDICFPPLRAGS